MERVLLVIPCFKERRRLPAFLESLCPAISASGLPVDLLIVDDGSGESESQFLAEFIAQQRKRWSFVRPAHLLAQNRGKGGAVYAGWEQADEAADRWLAFADADGAISAEEIVRILSQTTTAGHRDEIQSAYFAVRTGEDGTMVERTPLRRLSGRVFALMVRILFRMPIPDTQCGFKIVPRTWFDANRSQLVEERFCFDIEMAYWLIRQGISIKSVPISWRETAGSHLGFKHVLQMFASILVLRRRLE
ncbi:MAG: dolichyl-phosphate beta-glucosyltransferase [Verrucomicrobiales bacterium]|jgi:dolichyl-phosphate beta-glucosyltransferase